MFAIDPNERYSMDQIKDSDFLSDMFEENEGFLCTHDEIDLFKKYMKSKAQLCNN